MGVVGFLSVPKHFGIPSLYAFFPTSIPVKNLGLYCVVAFSSPCLLLVFFSYICLCVSNLFNSARHHHFLPINWEMEKSYNHIGYI
jgi:hypothetical protein